MDRRIRRGLGWETVSVLSLPLPLSVLGILQCVLILFCGSPTPEILEEELDVPYTVAVELLSVYANKAKEEETDLNKLFEGFGISEHGVVWWSIVLDKLQLQTQDSLWTILRYVLRELSTTVCIRLMEHFKFELSRYGGGLCPHFGR